MLVHDVIRAILTSRSSTRLSLGFAHDASRAADITLEHRAQCLVLVHDVIRAILTSRSSTRLSLGFAHDASRAADITLEHRAH